MPDLQPAFDELVRRLSAHEDIFHVATNLTDANRAGGRHAEGVDPDAYLLLGAPTEKYPGGLMFAAVRKGKRYVSLHLMCVYLNASLTARMSPTLARRRQGKSCFNVTRVDDALFDELLELTARGRDWFLAEGLAPAPRPGRG